MAVSFSLRVNLNLDNFIAYGRVVICTTRNRGRPTGFGFRVDLKSGLRRYVHLRRDVHFAPLIYIEIKELKLSIVSIYWMPANYNEKTFDGRLAYPSLWVK
jgi:hypothetical protein